MTTFISSIFGYGGPKLPPALTGDPGITRRQLCIRLNRRDDPVRIVKALGEFTPGDLPRQRKLALDILSRFLDTGIKCSQSEESYYKNEFNTSYDGRDIADVLVKFINTHKESMALSAVMTFEKIGDIDCAIIEMPAPSSYVHTSTPSAPMSSTNDNRGALSSPPSSVAAVGEGANTRKLEEEIASLQMTVSALRSRANSSESKLSLCETDLRIAKTLNFSYLEDLAQLQRVHADLSRSNDAMQNELKRSHGDKEDCKNLRKQIADLKRDVLRLQAPQATQQAPQAPQAAMTALEAENRGLRAELSALQSAPNKPPAALDARNASLSGNIAEQRLNVMVEELQAQVKRERVAVADAQAARDSALAQNARLSSDLASLRNGKPPLPSAPPSAVPGTDRYLKALVNLGGSAQMLSGSQDSFDKEFTRLITDYNGLRTTIHERNFEIEELERKMKALESGYRERESNALRTQAMSAADWTTDWLRSEVRDSDFQDFPANPAPRLITDAVGCDGMASPLMHVGKSVVPSNDFLFIDVVLPPELDPSTALFVYFRVLSFPPSGQECTFSEGDYGPVSQLSSDSTVLCEGGFSTVPFVSALARLPRCDGKVWVKWSVSVEDEAVCEEQIFHHVKSNQGQFFPLGVSTRHGLSCVPVRRGGSLQRVEAVQKNSVFTLKVDSFDVII